MTDEEKAYIGSIAEKEMEHFTLKRTAKGDVYWDIKAVYEKGTGIAGIEYVKKLDDKAKELFPPINKGLPRV